MKPATITIIIVSIIIFQSKSLHKVLEAFLKAAKNAIQKLEKVVDSPPPPHSHPPVVRGAAVPSSSVDTLLQFSPHPILIIGVSFSLPSLFLLSQELYLEVELFGLAAMDLSTDDVVLSIH